MTLGAVCILSFLCTLLHFCSNLNDWLVLVGLLQGTIHRITECDATICEFWALGGLISHASYMLVVSVLFVG